MSDLAINKILFPTDFSDTAAAALPLAAQLAKAMGAELHLLHAVVLHDFELAPEHGLPSADELASALERRAGDLLAALVEEAPTGDLKVVRAERRGIAAAEVILEYAAEAGIDLIVMSTHGRRGLRHFFLGSVAQEVVRYSPRPVLTVRGNHVVGSGSQAKILAAVDLSDQSDLVVRWASKLSSWTGAWVELFHVLEYHPPAVYEALPEIPIASIDELKAEAKGKLEQLRDSHELDPDLTTTVVVEGRAADSVIEAAKATSPDMIVVASHGRKGLGHLFLGSVAERIISHAEFPVLTVKPVAED